MKKIIFFLYIFFLALAPIGYFLSAIVNEESTTDQLSTEKYKDIDVPLLAVELEGNRYFFEMSLDRKHFLSLKQELLDKIEKKPYGMAQSTDLRGNKHESPQYLIDRITIGNSTFRDVIVVQDNDEDSSQIGTIGKPFLDHANLLFDYRTSKVIACENLDSVSTGDLIFEESVHVSFENNLLGQMIIVNTDLGFLRLVLSSSPYTCIRSSFFNNMNAPITSKINIGGKNFGELTIYSTEIVPSILDGIDGFLSRDFLDKHLIYIDSANKTIHIGTNGHLDSMPITFNAGNIPVIEIEIAGTTYPVDLDLGSDLLLSLREKYLYKIEKQPRGIAYSGDLFGNEYESPLYLLTEFKLGGMAIQNALVKQLHENSLINTHLVKTNPDSRKDYFGRVGRPVLEKVNLLLDFPHESVIACNSLNKLEKIGSDLKKFLQIPFELGWSGIIVKVETDLGLKRLVLDTGSTTCVIRTDNFIEQKCQSQKHGFPIYTTTTFSIMGHDFEEVDLWALGISPEIHDIDGILGMDFLEQYPIYIDYPNRMLYIGESNPQ